MALLLYLCPSWMTNKTLPGRLEEQPIIIHPAASILLLLDDKNSFLVAVFHSGYLINMRHWLVVWLLCLSEEHPEAHQREPAFFFLSWRFLVLRTVGTHPGAVAFTHTQIDKQDCLDRNAALLGLRLESSVKYSWENKSFKTPNGSNEIVVMITYWGNLDSLISPRTESAAFMTFIHQMKFSWSCQAPLTFEVTPPERNL